MLLNLMPKGSIESVVMLFPHFPMFSVLLCTFENITMQITVWLYFQCYGNGEREKEKGGQGKKVSAFSLLLSANLGFPRPIVMSAIAAALPL